MEVSYNDALSGINKGTLLIMPFPNPMLSLSLSLVNQKVSSNNRYHHHLSVTHGISPLRIPTPFDRIHHHHTH